MKDKCSHCRGAEYVLDYWLEKMLERENIHMTEIPPSIFKTIPVECLKFCHCNIRLKSFRHHNELISCDDCEGTTWRFSEEAEIDGYRWKKVASLTADELRELSCGYFERCPCGYDENMHKPPQKKRALLKDLLDSLENIKLPRLSFGWSLFAAT